MPADIGTSYTITIPYSGEEKNGLFILLKGNTSEGKTHFGCVLRANNQYSIRSSSDAATKMLGIGSMGYSNNLFTMSIESTESIDSFSASFLQLNLD